ncbi:MAG: hypothetical protein KJP21_00660 [Bacteroidia bacterium]|nr:hypothetical protein [Bacteroidia bacterium]NNJ56372.1 hypothetical protein [Bacteroidia bacterium]
MKKLLLILLIGSSFGLHAQSNLTLYHMETLPQRLQANPAQDPDCQWYLGMPGISSVDFNFNSNGLALGKINDAFIPRTNSDSFTFDITKLSNLLDKETFINIGVNQDWINFGFRVNKSLFTFNVTEKVKTRVSVPGDFFTFVFEGNGGNNLGKTFDFDWGVDVLHTREYALGYQRSLLDDRLRVGGRLKYVYGLLAVNTERNDLKFTTDPESFALNIESDLKVNMASSYLQMGPGTIEPDPIKAAFGADNKGWGFDLGASFDLTNRITLSASLVDMGQLYWKENTVNYQSTNPGASFEFRGVDIKDYIGDSAEYTGGIEELGDSLIEVFGLDSVNQNFTTTLLGEFYIGGTFKLTEKHKAGALFYGSFYNRNFYPALTLSWNSKFGRVLGLSASYTMMRGSFTNLGLGLSFNAGPEQLYFVSDNLIGAATGNVKNLSIRFGWNHTFGRKKREEKKNEPKT